MKSESSQVEVEVEVVRAATADLLVKADLEEQEAKVAKAVTVAKAGA